MMVEPRIVIGGLKRSLETNSHFTICSLFQDSLFQGNTNNYVTIPLKLKVWSRGINETDTISQALTDAIMHIEEFINLVADKDPDILVCPDCDNITFPWLATRATKNDIKLDLGRGREQSANGQKPIVNRRISIKNRKKRFLLPQQPSISGRVVLDFNSRPFPFNELGLAGLVERSRFSFLPMGIASRWGSNRIIDSRNCYELIQQGYVIPANRGFYEPIRTLEQIFKSDKGSMIISPQVGLHANVAVLDYDSEYPNIIVRNNLSYETVTAAGVRNDIEGLCFLR